ncbi:MAG: Hsp33 family molecular chaperone HslO [Betaproteobacteria bacterium]|nr:Hsp33 family molecular chaperone HslO [Betaproteobacteria bacterium]NBT74934.1 Hsp33 family molecular chaperone HslO [Betaproteobacteria bacterium]NBY13232.1 Hsp33 family molecular chaperone HslO [Betaproteobacteria bacterium]NCA15738.1 Hsp33 family molecular chaperone HslO [Betaproteobacteria bacterium]NDF03661.1 Hsp33 family molecular chaperone HslO [Betaproteobacteria bacterium]
MSAPIHLLNPNDSALAEESLTRLLFEEASARAHFVRLGSTLSAITSRHAELAPCLLSLLGEMSAATTLLSGALKFEGSVLLQLHGDGPVRLVVTECSDSLGLRGTLTLDSTQTSPDPQSTLTQLVNAHGQGRLSLVLDTKAPGQRPYQGIVAFEGEALAGAIESYMSQSEQLPTRLWLASDGQVAGGLLLQQMPQVGGTARGASDPARREDAWNRLCLLADTVAPSELMHTPPGLLLHQLFWEESARVLDTRHPRFECPCSRARVGRMLAGLGQDEVESILQERGEVETRCDFCNTLYRFDAIDCARLFTEGDSSLLDSASQPGSTTTH